MEDRERGDTTKMKNWYLVYTKPKNEDSVSDKLSRCGFEIFNPKIKERRCVRRKVREVVSSLFPCYVFVKFEIPKSYRLIKYTRGIKRVVGTESAPSPVNESIIESVRRRMEDGVLSMTPCTFTPGERVEIKAGQFEGLNAIFEREMQGSERVCVLLQAVNAKIVVDGAFIQKA